MIFELFAWMGLIIVSGFGLGSLLRAWHEDDSLSIRMGYAVGLGMIWNVLLLFISLTLIATNLLADSFYLIVIADLLVLIEGLVWRKSPILIKPTKDDLKVFAIVAGLALILILYFQKYPIFPEYDSQDFHQHFVGAISTEKNGVSINTGISYWGVIYLLAFALRFDNDVALIVVRQAMMLIVIMATFVVYMVSVKLFGKERAFWPSLMYAAGGFFWFGMVENAGLYPNFYGVISSLFLVGITIDYFEARDTMLPTALFCLSLFDLFFSHYSSFLILPSILVYGLFKLKLHPKKAVFLGVSIILPALYLLLGPFNLLNTFIGFSNVSGGPLNFPTGLSTILKGWPVLSYMIAEMYSDYAAIPMLLSGLSFIYLLLKTRSAKILIPFAWLMSILIIAPLNIAAWRFALVGLVPLTLMAGLVMAYGVQKAKRAYLPGFYPKRALVALALIAIVGSGGAIQTVYAFIPDYQQHQHDQGAVLQAMDWFSKLNCAPKPEELYQRCAFITPTDWELGYALDLYGNRNIFSCSYVVTPDIASQAAISANARYLIVTGWETCTPFPCSAALMINLVNSTAGHSLEMNITGLVPIQSGSVVQIGVNGSLAGSTPIVNNVAHAVLHFKKGGFYTIQAALDTKRVSWITNVYMGAVAPITNTPYSFTSCLPINWTSADLFGAKLVFDNSAVHIWEVGR